MTSHATKNSVFPVNTANGGFWDLKFYFCVDGSQNTERELRCDKYTCSCAQGRSASVGVSMSGMWGIMF